jgi:hypothetical protein
VEPAQIIASHIPFDYLWQFLIILLLMGETQVNKFKKYFDFEKEISNTMDCQRSISFWGSCKNRKNGLKKMILEHDSNNNSWSILRDKTEYW